MSIARPLAAALGLALSWIAPGVALAAPAAQTVKIEVTRDGFVPATITVKAGQPVTLEVTRKVERTCATEIVMKDLKVNQPLPLDRTVQVKRAALKPGTYRFACGMDMIAGVLKVE